jgi:hypothetical protein
LARNGQDIIVGEIIDKLYKHYCETYKTNRTNTDQPINHSNGLSQNSYRTTSHPTVVPRISSLEIPNNDDERRHLV